jgi:hypothetical protein
MLATGAVVFVFALLAFGVAAKIECPYCPGTEEGQTGGGANPQDLEVVNVKTTLFTETNTGCDMTPLFQVTVNMTLSDEGTTPWSGWVEANMTETRTEDWNSSRYVWVQLGPESTKSYIFSIVVDISYLRDLGFYDLPNFETSALPAQGAIICPVCNGSNKISVFDWLISIIRGGENVPQPA